MGKPTNELIARLQRNARFMGTCPTCSEDFSLADAILYSVDDAPPAEAVAVIQSIREAIKERKQELIRTKARMTVRAQTTAAAVNLGKIVEKIVPSFTSFGYPPGDCRALFEPIDYLIFSGLTGRRQVDSIHFVDVKSGRARLAPKQQTIRDVVQRGSVKFKHTKTGP